MSISKNRFAISVSGYDNQQTRRRASGYETLRTNHFITGQADKFAVLRGSQISKIQMFYGKK